MVVNLLIIFFLFVLLILFRRIVAKWFHYLFGLYFFIVLIFWSIPRIIPYNQLDEFLRSHGINYELLDDLYGSLYREHPYHNPLLPIYFSLILFLFYLIIPYIERYIKSLAATKLQISDQTPVEIVHIGVAVLIVLIFLMIKEVMVPFYFTQDDNHDQFFPVILSSMETLFKGGFPFIDNYHHFGAPIFEIGTYAIVDPFMILSYAVGRYVFSNPYISLEIYAFVSMFVAAVFMGFSLKLLRVDYLIAIAAIVAYCLHGYFFIAARSWYYVLSIECYLPILLYFYLLAVFNKAGKFWFIGLGVARSLFFYAGNAQFFFYGIIIEFLTYFFTSFTRKDWYLFLFRYFINLIFSTGLILPLLIPQYLGIKNVYRDIEWFVTETGIPFDGLLSSFLPFPITDIHHMAAPGNENQGHMANLYHIGFVWIISFYAGLIYYLRTGKGKFIRLVIIATIALLLSAGTASIIYSLKTYIPVINKMQKAFKIYPFATFLIMIYSSLILNEMRKVLLLRRVIIYPVLLSLVITFFVSVYGTNTSFCTFADSPYPGLPAGITNNVDKNDTIFSFGEWRYFGKHYVETLVHNYCCLYDLMCVNHYDPLLPTRILGPSHDLKSYFDRYGITKVLFQKIGNSTDWSPGDASDMRTFPVLYEDENIILYDTKATKWILRLVEDAIKGDSWNQIVDLDRVTLKAKIFSPVRTRWEYHNEYRDGYFLKVNGRTEKIFMSPLGWCVFQLEPSDKVYDIEIGYIPPLSWHALLGGIFLVIISGCIFLFLVKIGIKSEMT